VKTKELFFELPERLIAQKPPEKRGESRLMVLRPSLGKIEHKMVRDLPDLLDPQTIMVFNDSKVRKARFFPKRETGGTLETVFLRPGKEGDWEVLFSKAKKIKEGEVLFFPKGKRAQVSKKPLQGLGALQWLDELEENYFDQEGHIPLPPYIRREDNQEDWDRYQNIYAKEEGSAAAPTAGLHFTEELFSRLDDLGVHRCFVTLHVGLGTFLPVRTENIQDHAMHYEDFSISEETAELLTQGKREKKRILAVGSTSLRTLEGAWDGKAFKSGPQRTNLFCTPGYQFQGADALFTNFHTPESTLLALVCAFGGTQFTLNAYKTAVKEEYRFFSYGDATLFL